jgi:hypothetical protein
MMAYGIRFMCKVIGIIDQYIYKLILEDELLYTIEFYGLNDFPA